MRLFRHAALAVLLALSCGDAASAAVAPRTGAQPARFAGTTAEVPAQWPLPDLAAASHTCTRYAGSRTCRPRTRSHVATEAVKAAAMYSGLGFDTCAAPSAGAMKTWASASPYHAVGIYIGGIDRACPDGNLTPSWIQTVAGQGWKFFPIYVGLQAPCWKDPGGGHPPLIAHSRRWTQGQEAADDAVSRATHFGIAPGSPIYFDMEYYPRNDTGCTQDVQAFLSAWTDELHTRGYVSGIYSSSSGAVADMTKVYDTESAYRADVVWYAHWDKVAELFGDPTLADRFWPGARRIKQYQGGHSETYGGTKLNIDLDVLDAPVAALK